MAQEAWGRWGTRDEVGAPNVIGSEAVVRALSYVQAGRVISLAQPLSPRIPHPKHRAGVSHFMSRDGGDYAAGAKRPGGFQVAEDTLILPMHVGTHIDALCHVWYDDQLYNGFPGDSIRSTVGATHCGADKLPPIVTRGVLLDMVEVKGRPLKDGTTISREDLQQAARAAEVEIESGDAVLIRTGWLETHADGQTLSFDTEPGIDVGAALWIAEAGASVIGADNYAIEVLPFPEGTVFPVHQRLLRDYGIPLIEGLVLNSLAEAGARSFLFIAAPLAIVGATASPIAPIAVL